jgi:hypothetical protein
MNEAEEERVLRRFLLGELEEDERERIEERFMTDPDFKERTLMAEDQLVEDYLAGQLSEAERDLFSVHFLSVPDHRLKVRIAGSLNKYMPLQMPLPPSEPAIAYLPPSAIDGAIKDTPFWQRTRILVPTALTLLLAVVLGGFWLVGLKQRRNLAEVRRELQQLNAQPSTAASPSLFLTPLVARGGGDSNTFPSPAGNVPVQLWLMLVKDEYQSYQVVFMKEADAEQYPISGLRAETTSRGRAIPIRIPSKLLVPGAYSLKLNGIADNGGTEEVGEYNLQLTR